ncbi:MAG TPA: GNAT family N-acetyltransferase [Sphingomicrobium sp.]|nr:GNAT family N-acetyltransferase [Sphingomicrobium sp.]
MAIRKSAPGDEREVRRLSRKLFGPVDGCDYWDEQLFVHDLGNGRLGGFISISQRPWCEGSNARPVAYVEGWFVDRGLRRRGIGTKLLRAAEHWARLNGFAEICSDAELDNQPSLEAHRRLGFEPTLRLQYFRKALG